MTTVVVGDRAAAGWRARVAAPPSIGLLERAAAAALLLLAAPVMALVSLWVIVADGPPVLYRGRRLGFRRSMFDMYKFRTLRRDAACVTSDRLLRATDQLEIPGGRLLRDSRLDELPQLWNIVRGEMSFLGPRPERPSVYRSQCRSLPNYSLRFAVRPGMVGPSQLFTPHSTPKRYRARLDNAWARRSHSLRASAGVILCAVLAVAAKLVTRGCESVAEGLRARAAGQRGNRRRLRRARFAAALARIEPGSGNAGGSVTRLLDMNDQCLRLRAAPGLEIGMKTRLRLELGLDGRTGIRRIRRADCSATVVHRRADALVLEYSPATPRSSYVLHQYFLGESLAPRRVGASVRLLPAPVGRADAESSAVPAFHGGGGPGLEPGP